MANKEVILMEEVPTLGDPGQIVRVAPGYARNYLFPRKLAAPVTEVTRRRVEKKRKEFEAKRATELEAATKLVKSIEELTCTITVKAGADKKLFGSVTSGDIVDAMKLLGVTLDKHQLDLKEPIKQLGSYKVRVKLAPEVHSDIKLNVVVG